LYNPCLRRDEIITLLKQRFAHYKQYNLPVYGIQNTNLRDYTTTEKDAKRGVSRMPPANVRAIIT
jgi:hypothetical protein